MPFSFSAYAFPTLECLDVPVFLGSKTIQTQQAACPVPTSKMTGFLVPQNVSLCHPGTELICLKKSSVSYLFRVATSTDLVQRTVTVIPNMSIPDLWFKKVCVNPGVTVLWTLSQRSPVLKDYSFKWHFVLNLTSLSLHLVVIYIVLWGSSTLEKCIMP